MTLEQLNTLSMADATTWFTQTCAAQNWVDGMVNARPFAAQDSLLKTAQTLWDSMAEEDYLEAFTAHPMIGDVDSLRAKFANTKAMASGEQSGTAVASEQTLQALSELNHAYLKKNGFIFIICATGLSAETMLNALKARIDNARDQELQIAAGEQIKITLLRLNKGLAAAE